MTEETEHTSPAPGAASAPSAVRAPILMVDDHPANLLALEAILEPLGEPLVKANSGEEALRHLLKEDYAVILMDVQMPGMDGFKTASIIKERPRTRHVPIIFLTALSRDAAHVFKGYAQGAVDYLLKPFDPEILRSKVSVFVELFRKGEQLKRQEAMLREREREALERRSEQRYRALTDTMPNCVWAARPDGTVYYANTAAQEYESEGESAEAFLASVHPEERERLESTWNNALVAQRPFEGQFRIRRRSGGDYRWHLWRGSPELGDDGGVLGWVITATDFDDRKRAEDRLVEFKATLDATLDCVLFFSPSDLTIHYVNEGAVRQLGYSREELVGQSALALEPGFDEAAFRERIAPLREGVNSLTYSTTYRRKDGGELAAEVALQYFRGGPGGAGRFVSVARDITERRKAEEALRATNEAKDAFLAAASHELRTPLQAAKGHAHLALLKVGDKDEGPARALKIIMRQIDRMAKLVEDLLDVSRLQAGRLALEAEAFDLAALLRDTAERMQALSTTHPLDVDVPETLPLHGDRSRVEQVIVNLVSNAIRYSPEGGAVRIWARVEGEQVHFSVSDQGVGIPKEKQEVIFERFGRAHGARYGGLGLGLTISQGIVEQHKGRIWVESEGVAHRGSTFHVMLPLQQPAQAPRDRHAAHA